MLVSLSISDIVLIDRLELGGTQSCIRPAKPAPANRLLDAGVGHRGAVMPDWYAKIVLGESVLSEGNASVRKIC